MTTGTLFDDPAQVIRALEQQQTVCTHEVARALADLGKIRVLQKDEFLARQGELGSELFYILSGSVNVIVNGHPYKERGRGELIGEMAVIEPGERRSADLIATQANTIVLVVGASDFLTKATEEGQIWECIARELARRLRQRDEMFVPPNEKPVIFVASSSEGIEILKKTEAHLTSPEREIKPWNKPGLFTPSLGTLEELVRHAHEVDFAVIIVSTDDLRESRGGTSLVPRDNVMLECGLFMGALERDRAFVLAENDPDLALPSDLKGVTALFFRNDEELAEKLQEISETVDRKGRMLRYCKVL